MGSVGFPELIIIFVIALIIFGPRKLPEIGRSLGKSLAEFKKASNDLRSTLEEEIRLDETRSQLDASRAAQAAQDAQAAAALQAQASMITETPAGVVPHIVPHIEGTLFPFTRPTRGRKLAATCRSCPFPALSRVLSSLRPTTTRTTTGPARRCRFWNISTSSGNESSIVLMGVVVGVFVSFAFIERIVNFIWGPMRRVLPPGVKLIYTEPAEAFSLYIQISLLAGALLAAPWVMYQVWLFISPGLHSNEKKFAIPFVVFTTLGLLFGATFNHYIAFPFMIRFLASFNGVDLVFMPRIEDTFDMYLKMALGMAVVFQLPTVVFFLAKLNLVSARFLWSKGKYAILLAFIIGAVVTPTGDPINQTIFAAPIVILYFLSIVIAWIVAPKGRKAPPVD